MFNYNVNACWLAALLVFYFVFLLTLKPAPAKFSEL